MRMHFWMTFFTSLLSLGTIEAKAQGEQGQGQGQVASFHYWVDNVAGRQTVTANGGAASCDIDVSTLAQGIHHLYYMAEDDQGRLSAPRQKAFFVAVKGKGEVQLSRARYWIDDVKNMSEAEIDNGNVAFDIDVSQMEEGMHTLYCQTEDNKGRRSPTHSTLFNVVHAASDVVAVRYWVDDVAHLQRSPMSGGAAAWDIDVSNLSEGLHYLYYQVEDNVGKLGAPRVRHFYVYGSQPLPDNRIAAYEYWVGDGDTLRVTLDEPQQVLSLEGLDIATGDQTLCRVPANYTFSPQDGVASYQASIPFGLRVYSVAGVASETLRADSTQVTLPLQPVELAYGDSATTSTPRTDRVRDFLGLGQRGDSVTLSVRIDAPDGQAGADYSPLHADLFDAAGVRNGQSIDLRYGSTTRLTVVLPSDSAYLVVRPADAGPVAEVQMVVNFDKLEAPEPPAPPTYHLLEVVSEGRGGMVVVNRTDTILDRTQALQLEEGMRVELLFRADEGHRLDLATMNDSIDLLSFLQGDAYVIDSLATDVRIAARFVHEEVPPATYSVELTASGTGAVRFETIELRNATFTDQWGGDATYTLQFVPDEGSHLASATLNDSIDLKPLLANSAYTFGQVTTDIRVVALFQTDTVLPTPTDYADFTLDGLLYHVTDTLLWQTEVLSASDRQHLVVPQQVAQYGHDWTVTAVSDTAFAACTSLVSVQLPATVSTLSPASFVHCSALSAIDWQANAPLLALLPDNPNLLVYVSDSAYAPSGVGNVVVGGVCSHLTLTDDPIGFYALHDFTASTAVYSHTYALPTPIDGSYGWETLTLPFDVQLISHKTRGDIAPFAALDDEGFALRRPFWLCGPGETGFRRAAAIEAYVPYLIAMPNNPIYLDEYRLAGVVTFSSRNVQVRATGPALQERHVVQGFSFVPVYQHVEASGMAYALNIDGEGQAIAGSVFAPGLRDVQPFQAYLSSAGRPAPLLLPVKEMLDGGATGIQVPVDYARDKANAVYDLGGRRVDDTKAHGAHGGRLPKGVYVRGGKKLVVRQ